MTDLDARRELGLLLLLTAVMFITIVDFMVLMPLSPYLMLQFQVDPPRFGLLVSAYSLAAGAASLLAASIADRYDRRHALLFTFAGLTVATFGCALAVDFYTLLIARTVAGVFGGVIGSVVLAIVGDVVPPARRGRAMGWVMLGFSLAAVAGVPLGLFLAEHHGWRAPFAVLAGASALVWFTVWRLVPAVRGHLAQAPTGLWQGYRELLAVPNHWWACGVTALTMLSGFSVIPYISPSLVANVGLDPHYLAWVYFVGGGATLFTRPLVGRLVDRHRQAHVFAVLVLISFVPIVLVT
ncbi:MAG TPA: MFS transporter, partial [Chitinolyticbacter sp.]|nr:MFS transporter [Chitinolyticbacter sp.]